MASRPSPASLLDLAYQRAIQDLTRPLIADAAILQRLVLVVTCPRNRAIVRFLMACLLGKIVDSRVDIRKPYTKIGNNDVFSGRALDVKYITPFIISHHLPCNPTTAFLTPALRTHEVALTLDVNLVGRPRVVYRAMLELLDDIYLEVISPEDMLAEAVRQLAFMRDKAQGHMTDLLADLYAAQMAHESVPLSVRAIVHLIGQHLALPGTSRLPVLIVAAAYRVARIGEAIRPLQAHNAADQRTGALGDIDITLEGDDQVVTTYEMKQRRVTQDDIDQALLKLSLAGKRVDSYVVVTTETIEPGVQEYAASVYAATGGIEVVVLDCIGFLAHFLHLFHRRRAEYLEVYQGLILNEPDSAINQPLKEAWLALRRAALAGPAS